MRLTISKLFNQFQNNLINLIDFFIIKNYN
mgnify:CR=1 FL=1